MKKVQECEDGQQTPKKKHEWLENGYEWLKADKERAQLGERKRRKLEKKKRKRQEKQRKKRRKLLKKWWKVILTLTVLRLYPAQYRLGYIRERSLTTKTAKTRYLQMIRKTVT